MNTLSEQMEYVVDSLQKKHIRFALAGGLAASLYRKKERMTKDLDLLFVAQRETEIQAVKFLEKLGLKPLTIRMAELSGGPMHVIKNKSSAIAMVCGIPAEGSPDIQVDLLLPPIPWFESALSRAEKNLVDFGCGKIPCLTVEDVILSKLFAVENRSTRYTDLDDLQNIFNAGVQLNLTYLVKQMSALNLKIPSPLSKDAPPILRKLSKRR